MKQPYLFILADGGPMALAGLYDIAPIDNEDILSFAIVTNEPNSLAQPIHDRMPCILQPDRVGGWLDINQKGIEQLSLFPSDQMVVRRVNRAVGNPLFKDRDQIDVAS